MNNQQEPKDKLSQILHGVLNEEQTIRKAAEEEITNLTKNNLGIFILELSKKQADENEKTEIRQLSSTLIKNIINNENYTSSWLNLDFNLRNQIKTNILSTLISPDINVKKAAGLSIAGICRVELPKNQWNEIFNVLIGAAQNQNIDIQITSLITLGYIFEEISMNNINNDVNNNLIKLYFSILTSKTNNNKLAYNCLKSLQSFLPFMENFISSENKIVFFNLIQSYLVNNDEEIRTISIMIFSELIRMYYKHFEDYIDNFIGAILKNLENDSDNNRKLCIELLISVADIEINNKNNSNYEIANFYMLNKFNEKIGSLLLKYIITDKFDTEEYTLSQACCYLIGSMCQCCDYKFSQMMLDYYKNNISSNNPIIKFSALNVFRSVLETKEKEKIYNIVTDSLVMLTNFLVDQQTILAVKKLISKIMKSIVKNFGAFIMKDKDVFDKFMILFINLLKDSPPEIIFIILDCIYNFARQVNTSENMPTNLLSSYAKNYYEILLSLAQNINLYDPNNNIPMNALITLGTIGQHTANDVKILSCNTFKSLVEMFFNTLNTEAFNNNQMRLNYQEYISYALSEFLMNKNANEKEVRKLFTYIIDSFQQRQEVFQEGILLVGSISNYLQNGFINEMSKFSSYLIYGLNSTNMPSICKASFTCLSDIILSNHSDFNIYVNDYLKIIMNILSNNSVQRDLKPNCFNIISDLFLYCKTEVFKSFNDIMQIVGGALEACKIDLVSEKDYNNIKYFQDLRDKLLETLSCIFSSIQEINRTEEFIPYVKTILDFINIILREEISLTKDIIKTSIGIIADFCHVYGKNIKNFLNVTLLQNTIKKLENYQENENDQMFIDFINWAKAEISKVIVSY